MPSEKAFAYKLKMEALRHQGKALSQVATKSDSAAEIGKASNESRDTVFRYIRLTNLIPPILDMVDEGRIAFTPAVELSYLLPEEQRDLLSEIQYNDCTPNLSQAQRIKKLSTQGFFTKGRLFAIMCEEKANQKERLKIPVERVRKFFPKNYTTAQMENEIINMCEVRFRKRTDRDSR